MRHLSAARQVPPPGLKRELGFKARAAPATVSGSPGVKDHWIGIREGDAGTQAASQETCLSWSPNRAAGACCTSGTTRVATRAALQRDPTVRRSPGELCCET